MGLIFAACRPPQEPPPETPPTRFDARLECPAGQMPSPDGPSCRDVGWTECPFGFARDPSGWGCAPVVPRDACPPGTIATLGDTSCLPLGDCGAPFPPREATFFVDDDFTAAELDAHHFGSITEALAVAPAGATIAVEAGQYVEHLELLTPVAVVGRCPARVKVRADDTRMVGLHCAAEVQVRGLSLQGFRLGLGGESTCRATLTEVEVLSPVAGGVVATEGAVVTLRRVRVVGAHGSPTVENGNVLGVFAQGGDVVLDGSELDDIVAIGAGAQGPTATLAVRDTVIRRTREAATQAGGGLFASQGARVLVERSAVLETELLGLSATDLGTRVALSAVAISEGTDGRDLPGDGLSVLDAATVVGTDVQLARNHGAGALVSGQGSALRLTRATVVGTGKSPVFHQDLGDGVYLVDQAAAVLEDSAVVDNRRVSLELQPSGTRLEVVRSYVAGTRLSGPDEDVGGFGVFAKEGALVALDSVFSHHRLAALYSQHLSSFSLRGVLVRATTDSPRNPGIGHGIVSTNEGVLLADDVTLADHASVGVEVDASDGALTRSRVWRNGIGLNTGQLTLVEGDAPAAGDFVFRVDAATEFMGNAARTGTQTVPLPSL